jgi:hypothetical protein
MVALGALWYARTSARAAERSADAGDVAVSSGEASAEAARTSAIEAAKINKIEADRREEERERRHDDLGPPQPTELDTDLVEDEHGANFVGTIMVHRPYRIRAEAWIGQSYNAQPPSNPACEPRVFLRDRTLFAEPDDRKNGGGSVLLLAASSRG